MESLNPKKVLEFMALVNNVKHRSRRGWDFLNVPDHEQVSGHMYAMGMMTFLLGDNSNLDRFKCLQLALVHDLAESIVGDITPHDNIGVDRKHQMEDTAMKEITSHLSDDIGGLIYSLYKEYEAKESPESIFVKDLDNFDLLFTAVQYEKRDQTPKKTEELFRATENKFKTPFVQNLFKELLKYREQEDEVFGNTSCPIPNGH